MPTTLPARFRDSRFGRERGPSRSMAALRVWAVTMLSMTVPVKTAHTADVSIADTVLQ